MYVQRKKTALRDGVCPEWEGKSALTEALRMRQTDHEGRYLTAVSREPKAVGSTFNGYMYAQENDVGLAQCMPSSETKQRSKEK